MTLLYIGLIAWAVLSFVVERRIARDSRRSSPSSSSPTRVFSCSMAIFGRETEQTSSAS